MMYVIYIYSIFKMLINNIICIKCKPDFTFFSDFFAFYNNIVYLCRKQSYNKYLIYYKRCYYNKIQKFKYIISN